jgi:hypothetical protein
MSVDSLLAQFDQEDAANEKNALSRSALISHNVNPDKYAANVAKAKKIGIPTAFAAPATGPANGDDLRSLMDDFHKLPAKAPATAAYLTNPDNAKLAHDDHPVLSRIEGALASLPNSKFTDVMATVGSMITSPVRQAAEGYRAVAATAGTLAGGGTLDQALEAGEESMRDDEKAAAHHPTTSVGKATEKAISYPFRKWSELGDRVIPSRGNPLTEAADRTLWEFLPFVAGAKRGDVVGAELAKKGVEPTTAQEIASHVDEVAASSNAQAIQDVVDTAKESKLAKRSPEDFHTFTTVAAKGAPPVSMPVEKFEEMLAAKGLKPEDVLQDPAPYYEARAEGTKVAIPAADLAGMADHVTPDTIQAMSVGGAPSMAEVEQRAATSAQVGAGADASGAVTPQTTGKRPWEMTEQEFQAQPEYARIKTENDRLSKSLEQAEAGSVEYEDLVANQGRLTDYLNAADELNHENYLGKKNVGAKDLEKARTEKAAEVERLRQAAEEAIGKPEGSEGSQAAVSLQEEALGDGGDPGTEEAATAWPESDHAITTMEDSARKAGVLTEGNQEAYRSLAEAAAAVDGKGTVEAAHSAEAIQYLQSPDWAKPEKEGASKGVPATGPGSPLYERAKQIFDKAGVPVPGDKDVSAAGAKQPWEVTLDEFKGLQKDVRRKSKTAGPLAGNFEFNMPDGSKRVYENINYNKEGAIRDFHRKEVEKALQLDKPVPVEVLAGYPDLQPSGDIVNLHMGVNPLDGVKAAMHIAGEIRDSKAGKTVEQLMTPGLEAGENAKQGIASLVLPTMKSPEHLAAAELLGAKLGKMHRNQETAAAQLHKDSLTFDKMGVHNDRTPLTENPGLQFMSDMSQGRQMEPQLQAVADRINTLFEDRLAQLEAADVPVETTRENYFPGMWTNESRKAFNQAIGGAIERGIGEGKPLSEWTAEEKAYVHDRVKVLMEGGKGSTKEGLQYLARTPFKGRESFRKGKVFDDIMTAVEFGLEPISRNPVDLVKLKLAEMDRSIMANSALQEWRAKGDERFLPVSQRVPEGWVKVNDKYGTVYGPMDMAGEDVYVGRPLLGYRIVKEPVADILNNFLSSSMYNNKYFGTLYKGYMGMANALNQSQLGVGSAFHVGFTEAEVVISGGANLVKDVYGVANGTRTVKQLAKTAVDMPLSFIKTPMEGNAILKEWRNPGATMNPRVEQVVKAAELAGGGFKLEQGLRTNQTAKMVQDWYGGHEVKAVLRAPVSAVELMAKPIMDWLVPRQKAGVFGHLADRIIEQNPGKALEDLVPEFRQAWNRIDARLGQVRYDRLFMNNSAKNAVQALVRAPGWAGGTIAEIGGAFKDAATFLKEWATTGEAPKDIPDRVAYTISLMATTTAVSGLLTYLFTGQQPTGVDFWAFRTGGTDEHGRPERFILPTYAKDIYAYAHDPGKTLLAKTHPVISIIGDLLRNKDYYGVTIANEDDSQILKAIDRGEYVLKSFVPFWMRGAQKEAERGGGLAETLRRSPQKLLAPQIGVMPASSDYTLSAAEKLLNKYSGEQIPQGGRTKEQAEATKARREILRALRGGASMDELPAELQDHLDKMTTKQVHAIQKDAELTPLQASFQHLQDPTLEKSMNVWKKASDAEREQLRDIYETRINLHMLQGNLDEEEYAKLEERIRDAEDRKPEHEKGPRYNRPGRRSIHGHPSRTSCTRDPTKNSRTTTRR